MHLINEILVCIYSQLAYRKPTYYIIGLMRKENLRIVILFFGSCYRQIIRKIGQIPDEMITH